MAQLDSLIICSLIFSLLIVLFIYYTIMLKTLIPSIGGVKKLRNKKLNKA